MAAQHSNNSIVAALRIGSERETKLDRGDPLCLALGVFNEPALICGAKREELTEQLAAIEQGFAAGTMAEVDYRANRDLAERQLSELVAAEFTIGTPQRPWGQVIRFTFESGGSWIPLGWPLRSVHGPGEAELVLDHETTCSIEYDLNPEAAKLIPAGRYRIRAEFDAMTTGDESILRVESNPVVIEVSGVPAVESDVRLLRLADYFGRRGDYGLQREYAANVLRRHPDSAVALYLLGRAEEGRGDDEEALRLYQAAVEQFDLQCPDSYERPEVVIQRIVDLQRKLALRGG